MIQQRKRNDQVEQIRLFQGGSVPKIVALIPCCIDVDSKLVLTRLAGDDGVVDVAKQKVQFIPCKRNLLDILDAAKVADLCVLLLSAQSEVDAFGQMCLSALMAQGAPSVVSLVSHLDKLPVKKHSGIRHSLGLFVKDRWPDEEKMFSLDSESECANFLRSLTTHRLKQPSWRERCYMYIDKATMLKDDLVVTGYVRGNDISPNQLVYIPNCGDYQISKITTLDKRDNVLEDVVPDEEQESLLAENEPDPMMADQTWPTAEELAEADARVERKRKRVPKGTSTYQAAWIPEDDVENGHSEDDVEVSDSPVEEEWEHVEEEDKDAAFDQLNEEQEEAEYKEYMDRLNLARQDKEFPDEVDTPKNVAARVRFQKYRGLKSFRSSTWDPYENLPVDYARIFQFENFRRTRERVLKQAQWVEGVTVGTRVEIHVKNFDKWTEFDALNVKFLFALLPHEHKMSILNMTLTRTTEYQEPVKSKDDMVVQVGFRRFSMQPVYSSNTRGGNNVHKFERFFQPGETCIATAFAPIHYAPCPVLMFLPNHSVDNVATGPIFVASGSVMDVDPTRILAKRIILTGHPFKINKRSVVVRYMFFNQQDVAWFKPIQLVTKYGRTGHIKESVGTHGYMKCIFDGKVNAQDTVCLNLYKRIFPKWTTHVYTLHLEDWDTPVLDAMEIE
jgi:pre-rRNA-processing protein TSR1